MADATDDYPAVKLDQIKKSFGDHVVLNDVSLEVRQGEVVSIIGPSGAGKSTFLRCTNFLERPDSGRVQVVDHVINATTKPNPVQLQALRKDVGMVFQSFNLFPHLSVLENINLAQRRVLNRSVQQASVRSRALLERVELSGKADEYPNRLSGGQQQRVAIARALAMDPKVMLFDEPTSALDPEVGLEVLSVIQELARSGMTMIIVTHEIEFARKVGDRLVVMADGKIIESGPPDELLDDPKHPRTRRFLQAVTHR